MNYLKSITIGAIALFLFIGTVGVNVFSHACEEDGLEVSYFLPNEDICEKHDHEEEKVVDDCDDCCCDEQSDDNDCCSTSAELVKVDLEFLNKLIVKAILIPTEELKPIWEAEEVLISAELHAASGTDPPPKKGQDLCIEFQQWLI